MMCYRVLRHRTCGGTLNFSPVASRRISVTAQVHRLYRSVPQYCHARPGASIHCHPGTTVSQEQVTPAQCDHMYTEFRGRKTPFVPGYLTNVISSMPLGETTRSVSNANELAPRIGCQNLSCNERRDFATPRFVQRHFRRPFWKHAVSEHNQRPRRCFCTSHQEDESPAASSGDKPQSEDQRNDGASENRVNAQNTAQPVTTTEKPVYTAGATKPATVEILGKQFPTDAWTNVTPRVLRRLGANLHRKQNHPLHLLHLRIKNHFYARFQNHVGNPSFTMVDNLQPVVTPHQNFDSLLVPIDHVSRSPRDTYYINASHLLRAHTSAHQEELIRMGFDCFLVFGDVYRRDEIDPSHYPVFHQCEGVRLFSQHKLLSKVEGDTRGLSVLEGDAGQRTNEKQGEHSMEAAKLLEHDLKSTLLELTRSLFGKDIEYRWVTDGVYFPFTHPSWELEIQFEGQWMEVLGSGIIEQQILKNAGAGTQVGWAFGLGLDRLAMKLYGIPDIRILWSEDERFLQQFNVPHPDTPVKFKPFSLCPPCPNDISFWLPTSRDSSDAFSSNDFYDLVRDIGGDTVETVSLIDEFVHPKSGRTSHCYRIVYRHMERPFKQTEVNEIHKQIEEEAARRLGVEVR